jgi:cysteine desulfurase
MSEIKKIYFDYAASTPLDPRVLEKMMPFFSDDFGNPSSIHTFGQRAEAAVDEARETVAACFHCDPEEIVFTGCGTESDNLALRGAVWYGRKMREANHILISPVEHHAVSITAEQLAHEQGFELEYIPVDEYGQVDPDAVAARLKPDTAIVSVVYANNEIGTINPVAEIGAVCAQKGIPFHTDAVQAAAHLQMDVQKDKIDLMAIGAHKFYGPKGVGALFIRNGTKLLPVITGGQQEFGLRAGTLNVPYIIGLAEALKLGQEEIQQRSNHVQPLRDELVNFVLEHIADTRLTGHPQHRLPNHASFVFKGVNANALLLLLDMEGFACSSGSACKVGNPKPSDILTAIGLPDEWALGSLRITLGKYTTLEQVRAFEAILPVVVEKARRISNPL